VGKNDQCQARDEDEEQSMRRACEGSSIQSLFFLSSNVPSFVFGKIKNEFTCFPEWDRDRGIWPRQSLFKYKLIKGED